MDGTWYEVYTGKKCLRGFKNSSADRRYGFPQKHGGRKSVWWYNGLNFLVRISAFIFPLIIPLRIAATRGSYFLSGLSFLYAFGKSCLPQLSQLVMDLQKISRRWSSGYQFFRKVVGTIAVKIPASGGPQIVIHLIRGDRMETFYAVLQQASNRTWVYRMLVRKKSARLQLNDPHGFSRQNLSPCLGDLAQRFDKSRRCRKC